MNTKKATLKMADSDDSKPSVEVQSYRRRSVTFADESKVKSGAEREIFMPIISELLSQETLLEQYASASFQNKSRKLNRRHLSVTSLHNDMENLKQYLGDKIKSKNFPWLHSKDDSSSCCSNKSVSCCRFLLNIFACLLCIPCLLVEFCKRKIRCRKPKIDIFEIPDEKVSVMEDYDYFWDPVDVTPEESNRYEALAKPVLCDWLQTRNPDSWQKIDREMAEICVNDYSNRLKIWLDLYESEGVDMHRDMVGQGLKDDGYFLLQWKL